MQSPESPEAAGVKEDFVDLHIHTIHSGDAQYLPGEIFEFAREAGMGALAFSDHDSVDAIPAGVKLSDATGIEFIPSIELTTEHEERELHLLGPYVEWRCPQLADFLERLTGSRLKQAEERIARLVELGFEVSLEEAVSRTGGAVPSGTTIAAVILDKSGGAGDSRLVPYLSGARSDRPEINFHQDFMNKGAPAYVPHRWPQTRDAIRLLLDCGAIPVLAHPGAGIFSVGSRLIEALKEAGLKGVEVFTSYHDSKVSHYYLNVARKLNLIPTAGSDFHGRIKPHVAFGSVRAIGCELIRVLRNCRQGAADFSGSPIQCT